MNEILLFITFSLLGLCAIFLLIYWKISSDKKRNYDVCCTRLSEVSNTLTRLDTIIDTSVGSINQKMVSHLKEYGNFTQSDKEEAFHECRRMIYTIASPNTLVELSCMGVNVEDWISTRIEYFVRKHKTLKNA